MLIVRMLALANLLGLMALISEPATAQAFTCDNYPDAASRGACQRAQEGQGYPLPRMPRGQPHLDETFADSVREECGRYGPVMARQLMKDPTTPAMMEYAAQGYEDACLNVEFGSAQRIEALLAMGALPPTGLKTCLDQVAAGQWNDTSSFQVARLQWCVTGGHVLVPIPGDRVP